MTTAAIKLWKDMNMILRKLINLRKFKTKISLLPAWTKNIATFIWLSMTFRKNNQVSLTPLLSCQNIHWICVYVLHAYCQKNFMNSKNWLKSFYIFPFMTKKQIFGLLSGQQQQQFEKTHQSSFEAAGHGQYNKQYRHWTPHDVMKKMKC